jgi:hypothetical protein
MFTRTLILSLFATTAALAQTNPAHEKMCLMEAGSRLPRVPDAKIKSQTVVYAGSPERGVTNYEGTVVVTAMKTDTTYRFHCPVFTGPAGSEIIDIAFKMGIVN